MHNELATYSPTSPANGLNIHILFPSGMQYANHVQREMRTPIHEHVQGVCVLVPQIHTILLRRSSVFPSGLLASICPVTRGSPPFQFPPSPLANEERERLICHEASCALRRAFSKNPEKLSHPSTHALPPLARRLSFPLLPG